MEKLSDSLYFIPGRRYDSNSILVISDTTFLVDTGTGALFPELANELARCGVTPDKVDAIVNTHGHFDHIGGNHHFPCPKHIHRADQRYAESANPEFTRSFMFSLPLEPQKMHTLPSSFHGWEVLHTPGHTPGSICLYKKPYLISGDTLFTDGYGRTDMPGGDEAALRQSLAMLEDLDYKCLLPGHGPMGEKHTVKGPQDLIWPNHYIPRAHSFIP